MSTTKYTQDLQSQLPSLPVPDLSQTRNSLKEWIVPLLNESELDQFNQLVDRFAQTDGPSLQKQLLELANQTTGSWLAPIWENSYLNSREPLQASSNFAFTVASDYIPTKTTGAHLGAEIISHLTDIYLSFATESHPIDQFKNGQLMDMTYYANFFKSMRLAAKPSDHYHQGPLETASQQVTIIKNGYIYFLPVTDETGNRLSTTHLEVVLKKILNNPDTATDFPGVITGLPRQQATQLFNDLFKEPQNNQLWGKIADSLFAVSFLPVPSDQNYLKTTLLGAKNRLIDKTLQVVIFDDHQVGYAIEHSRVDGVPALNLIQQTMQALTDATPLSASAPSDSIQPITFSIDADLHEKLKLANQTVKTIYQSIIIDSLVFQKFGNSQIKAAHVSPDAFFQIALAMAMFRLTHQWRSIYEPVSMRQFYQGRTENARSLSIEKKKFIQAFLAHQNSVLTHQLFDQAVKAHVSRIKMAQKGLGVERHLLGLETILNNSSADHLVAHQLFNSSALAKLRTDFLSTTSIPFPIIQGLTFAPTSTDGYGVYYGILPDQIRLSISAWNGSDYSPTDWLQEISKSLEDLMAFVTEAKTD